MLSELGGYEAERIALLRGPSRAQLLAQLDARRGTRRHSCSLNRRA